MPEHVEARPRRSPRTGSRAGIASRRGCLDTSFAQRRPLPRRADEAQRREHEAGPRGPGTPLRPDAGGRTIPGLQADAVGARAGAPSTISDSRHDHQDLEGHQHQRRAPARSRLPRYAEAPPSPTAGTMADQPTTRMWDAELGLERRLEVRADQGRISSAGASSALRPRTSGRPPRDEGPSAGRGPARDIRVERARRSGSSRRHLDDAARG